MRPSTTALVFQGLQNDFCHPQGALYPQLAGQLEARRTVARLVELAEAVLDRGCPVFCVPIVFTPDYRELAAVGGILGAIREAGAFQEGSWGAEPVEALRPLLDRIQVLPPKRGLCAFGNASLDRALRRAEVETVAVGGLLTNVCVESTARTAYDFGYRVVLVKDSTATTSEEAQRASEDYVFPLLGQVLGCSELLERLSEASDAPQRTA